MLDTNKLKMLARRIHDVASQFSDSPAGDLQAQADVQERNTSPQVPETPLETLSDPGGGQSMTYQKGLVHGRSNRRRARENTSPTRPYGIQTRSKTGPKPKSKRIEPSNTDLNVPRNDNTARDGRGNAGRAAAGKRVLVRGTELLGKLYDKAGRAGQREVMREVVYDMVSTLRVGVIQQQREFNFKTQEAVTSNLQSGSLQVSEGISSFRALREELEISRAGEQLSRLRRRVTLVQFYDKYTRAQADPNSFLYPEQKQVLMKSLTATRKRKRASSSNVAKRCGNKRSTLVHNRVVDLMFPHLVLSESDEARAKQEEKVWNRKAASMAAD